MTNPFPYSDTNRRFYTLDYYYRRTYGKKCFKVPLDGGFTCPNLDGAKGTGGCVYCALKNRPREVKPLRGQFDAARAALHKKWPDALYIAYFNDFTNTYAPPERLRALYGEALSFENVVGLNIATRADALPGSVTGVLRETAKRTDLTVELGLQSSSDETARRINRCHTLAEFCDAYERLCGINICVHIIDGLPGEDRKAMLETARFVAGLRPHSVKIHLLHILRGTVMAELYERGEYTPLTPEQYAEIVASQIELLPPETVIARVTGDGLPGELIAPDWSRKKFTVMNSIDKLLVSRNSWQGKMIESC